MNSDAHSKSDTGIRGCFVRPEVELFGNNDREGVFGFTYLAQMKMAYFTQYRDPATGCIVCGVKKSGLID